MLAVLLIGSGVILIVVVIGVVISISSERTLVDERLGKYLTSQALALFQSGLINRLKNHPLVTKLLEILRVQI
jgi:hypothetical protein